MLLLALPALVLVATAVLVESERPASPAAAVAEPEPRIESTSPPPPVRADGDWTAGGQRVPIIERGRALAGRLINPSGKPVRNWRIRIRPDPPFDEEGRVRPPVVETVTDAHGEFRASGVAPGPLSARIDRGDPLPPVIRRIGPAAGEVEIVFGSPTVISGKVKDARSGVPIRSFTVIGYGNEVGEQRGRSRGGRSQSPRQVVPIRSKDGSFRVTDLHFYGEGAWFEAKGYEPECVPLRGVRADAVDDLVVRLRPVR